MLTMFKVPSMKSGCTCSFS